MSENQNYINTLVLSVKCPDQFLIKYSEWIPAKSRLSENTYLFVAATFRLRLLKIPQACGYDIIIKIIQFSDSLKRAGMTIINLLLSKHRASPIGILRVLVVYNDVLRQTRGESKGEVGSRKEKFSSKLI